MLSNYFKLAIRSLRNNPQFSFLNILGLSLGLTVALLLLAHVRHERSFDRFHSKAERIFRATVTVPAREGWPARALSNAPNSVAPVMRENIPAIEQSARLLLHNFGEPAFIRTNEQRFSEKKFFWADPSLTEIFDFQVVAGDFKTALAQPNAVLLSRSTALRYFGTAVALGQTIRVDNMQPLEVKGIFEDFPGNSTLDAELIGSFSSVKWANERLTWDNASFETWFLLQPDARPDAVLAQMNAVFDKNVPKERQRYAFGLQALTDVHFGSTAMMNSYSSRLGDARQVAILSGLAAAVLLIACFNYMNLATARSQRRSREVGINKTLGAGRGQISMRFLVETGVFVGISLLVSSAMLAAALPFFNNLTEKNLPFNSFFKPEILLGVLALAALVTVVAGSYPAIFLSSFTPKNLMQRSLRSGTFDAWMRRTLVVTQFAVATVLIVGTLVLYRQNEFIRQKKLGFEPSQVVAVSVKTARELATREALLQKTLDLAGVKAASYTQTFPGRSGSGRTLQRSPEDQTGSDLTTCHAWPDFEKVLSIKTLAGRSILPKAADDTTAQVVLNRSAVEFLGLTPENALGKRLDCQLGPAAFVVGVVEDFHAESLHKPISPYAFHNWPSEGTSFLLVKTETENLPETMRQLETTLRELVPEAPFEYTFLDEYTDKLYRSEHRNARIALIFTVLAIFISCLGLLGLAAFTAEQRTKEVGIRKILGASVAGILGLLASDFLKLVAAAIVVATPLAYFFMQKWLSDFAYRIELQWWMFLLAGGAAVLVAGLTVGFQSLKTALANPARSLKSE